MAVSISNLTAGDSQTDTSSYSTASISPGANRLILATVVNRTASGTPNQPTLTGNSLTWVAVNSVVYDTSGSQRRITVFRAMGASPTTGAITIDLAAQTNTTCMWAVDEATGVDTSGTNGSGAVVQSAVNSTASDTSLTATLAAFASTDNATFGAAGEGGGPVTLSVGSGFTQLSNSVESEQELGRLTEWKSTNDTSVDFSCSSAAELGIIGIEIKAQSAVRQFALLGVG